METTSGTASIRELRTDFRSVKRKLENHGLVIITDNGVPSYEIRPIRVPAGSREIALPDYMARLRQQSAEPMSPEATTRFWEEERADR